ncbi:hypothetical protein F7725_027053 [Dissostichus mawsoni]|uniref:Uncharacterized protein n=1 Tax=Dissostichus mawsoni TaxID=36200 RepID=A0A7J5XBW3_DISMA|nr:hypothetical protein F7725_027053 [Dissostichus mawsoni]
MYFTGSPEAHWLRRAHLKLIGSDGPHLKLIGSDEPHLKLIGSDGPHLKLIGSDEPHLKLIGSDGPHLKLIGSDGAHLKLIGSDGPHLKLIGSDEPHLKLIGSDGPHLKLIGSDEPHLKLIGSDGPHLKLIGSDGAHLKLIGSDGPHLKLIGSDGPHMKLIGSDEPHLKLIGSDGANDLWIPPQAPPPAVLIGPPGSQEVGFRPAAGLQVKLSLEPEGQNPVLVLDPGLLLVLVQVPGLLLVQVQVPGLLLALPSPLLGLLLVLVQFPGLDPGVLEDRREGPLPAGAPERGEKFDLPPFLHQCGSNLVSAGSQALVLVLVQALVQVLVQVLVQAQVQVPGGGLHDRGYHQASVSQASGRSARRTLDRFEVVQLLRDTIVAIGANGAFWRDGGEEGARRTGRHGNRLSEGGGADEQRLFSDARRIPAVKLWLT